MNNFNFVYNYDYEKINYKDTKRVAGFDESGRGAIAGPLVVAAVILPRGFHSKLIKDSKKLSYKGRQLAYNLILSVALAVAVKVVEIEYIEKHNPKQASIYGMKEAFKNLKIKPEVCLVDFEKPRFEDFSGKIESLIKGDQKSLCIAAASILAKVKRDEIMKRYHHDFPQYNFDLHKGYYTRYHKFAIEKYGFSSLHRKNYFPFKKLIS